MILMMRDGTQHGQIAFVPVVAHARGLAVANLDPAVARQALQGFAQGRARDAQLLRQIALGWQVRVDGKIAIDDGVDQAAFDQFGRAQWQLPVHGGYPVVRGLTSCRKYKIVERVCPAGIGSRSV